MDGSFSTLFIIISLVNVSMYLRYGMQNPEDLKIWSSIWTAQIVPIFILVFQWWIGIFWDKLQFKLVSWFLLFTIIYYDVFFLFIGLGIDLLLGLNTYYLVLFQVLSPIPSFITVNKFIKERYCKILGRSLQKNERNQTIILIVSNWIYYWLIAYDPIKILNIIRFGEP